MPFDAKILFDAPYYRDRDQSAFTIFGSIEDYNRPFTKIESLHGDKRYECKLGDVNLYDFKLFHLLGLDRYSIAEMAYEYSKQQWVVSIININSNNVKNKSYSELGYNYNTAQIQFEIDIAVGTKAT